MFRFVVVDKRLDIARESCRVARRVQARHLLGSQPEAAAFSRRRADPKVQHSKYNQARYSLASLRYLGCPEKRSFVVQQSSPKKRRGTWYHALLPQLLLRLIAMSLRSASRSLFSAGPRLSLSRPAIRYLSTPSETPETPAASSSKSKKPLSSAPYKVEGTPQFPPPVNPFETKKAEATKAQEYSETTKNVVKGVARLMGYNSSSTTAIRETGRMMKGVVNAVEKDRDFWYNSEFCSLWLRPALPRLSCERRGGSPVA